jgi:hypothetical protein
MADTSWFYFQAELCARLAADAVDPRRRSDLEIEGRLWLQVAASEMRQEERRKKPGVQ